MSNGLATHLEIEFSDAMSFGVRTVVKVRLGCVTEGEGKVSGEGMTDPLVPSIPTQTLPTQTPGPHIPNIHLNLFLSIIFCVLQYLPMPQVPAQSLLSTSPYPIAPVFLGFLFHHFPGLCVPSLILEIL